MRILLLLLVCSLAFAANTTVTDTVYDSGLNPVRGKLYITPSQTWTCSGGEPVYPREREITVASTGVFTVSLCPTDTATPTGVYYTARFVLSNSRTVLETWTVPTSGSPIGLSAVRVNDPPAAGVSTYLTSLNGLTPPVQLFARVNDTNVNLAWSSATATHTLTASWAGQLSALRGGTGDDTSAVTGVTLITAGNWTYVAAASDLSGWPSGLDMTELGYVNGVTSAIQTQIDAKAASSALSNYLPLAGGTMTGSLLLVPASGAYALDLQKSGSSGTLRVYDQTAVTGATRVVIRQGADQCGAVTDLLLATDATSQIAGWDCNGSPFVRNASDSYKKTGVMSGTQGYISSSDKQLLWCSGTDIDACGALDLGLSRNAAGVVEVNNGTPGQYRDTKLRSPQVTANTETTCDLTVRGTMVMVQGGAGIADTWRICGKSAADIYDWRPMF